MTLFFLAVLQGGGGKVTTHFKWEGGEHKQVVAYFIPLTLLFFYIFALEIQPITFTDSHM